MNKTYVRSRDNMNSVGDMPMLQLHHYESKEHSKKPIPF